MKRRILALLIMVITLLVCVCSLTACRDGINGKDGIDGKDGADGKDGVGISDAYIDGNGHLILEFTDGTKKDCGKVTADVNGTLLYDTVLSDGAIVGYSVVGTEVLAYDDVVIPARFNGLPVLSIGERAFSGCDWIKSVSIPDSITEIGGYAFYECSNLESVTIGTGVKKIGKYSFGRCDSLQKVNVGDVGVWCEIEFENLSANPLYFADELYIAGQPAEQLIIADDVTKITDYAFYECKTINSLIIGGNVTSIGDYAFYNCYNLLNAEIGNDVATIGESAFELCGSLRSLYLGEKLTDIGTYAFYQCYSLPEVNIPSSVRTIGDCAFLDCYSLESITVENGVQSIGSYAFAGCSMLSSFDMPDSVTSVGIGVLMFGGGGAGFGGEDEGINSLGSIKMSESLTEIPDYAFSKTNITNIKLGGKVTTVHYSSFYGCSLLKSVLIPKSVTKIESYSFYRCPSLQEVYYEGSAREWAGISIGKNGNEITNAENVTIYYYSETQPEEEGNFWHYSTDGSITVWGN